ncbi:expressed unknown protein [Seminavis robusta]|uniref:Uncharacterized protein n=1 Tax=Seminavis robusta TaxID=568900 RepID=A0A9N8H8Q4_9STRA|nr:expressed unknown protein [Seminavis robusta]|eukprot:Sro227_g092170.1 n/a (338) ;mRNA; f:13816-14829
MANDTSGFSPDSFPFSPMTPTRKKAAYAVTPLTYDNYGSVTLPSSRNMQLHKSPDNIKLRLPGTSTSTKRLPRPIALFQTPPRMLKALRNPTITPEPDTFLESPPRREASKSKKTWISSFFENAEYCDGCSCMDGSATTAAADNRAPWSVRLTEDLLQQHDQTSPLRQTPSMVPHFAGDKLAKTVIRKKTQHELAKERRQRAKMELSHVQSSVEEHRYNQIETVLQPLKKKKHNKQREWLETEREKALSAKWQRKKREQKDRMRTEQLRWSELERQRNLRAVEIRGEQRTRQPPVAEEMISTNPMTKVKRWSSSPQIVSPETTPNTQRSSSKNLILI